MMDWDTEVKLFNAEHMITVYEKHIEHLEKENKSLRLQVEFLKQQLSYKTFGKPTNEEVSE
jgi:regulator of replication initiation timing|tara:strand:+ start:206 stop:388 length:183 start_codon:yes stop_codon:yes gene_type:complete